MKEVDAEKMLYSSEVVGNATYIGIKMNNVAISLKRDRHLIRCKCFFQYP